MKRVALVVGTRPELIKMRPVYRALRKLEFSIEPTVVIVEQQPALIPLHDAGFEFIERVGLTRPSERPDAQGPLLAQIVERLDARFVSVPRFDFVVVQGDTTTTLGAALAAFYHRIPIAHVEAGLRTSNLLRPFPEEMDRRVVSRLATLHFAPTARAVQELQREHVTGRVFFTGNTVVDALLEELSNSDVDGASGGHVLVTCHRRETWGLLDRFTDALARLTDVTFLWPVHPNPLVERAASRLRDCAHVTLTGALDRAAFLHALRHARCVVTDSGGVIEEAVTLGVPTIIIRDETERPEAIEAGCAELCPLSELDTLGERIARMSAQPHEPSMIFGWGRAGTLVADAILQELTSSVVQSAT